MTRLTRSNRYRGTRRSTRNGRRSTFLFFLVVGILGSVLVLSDGQQGTRAKETPPEPPTAWASEGSFSLTESPVSPESPAFSESSLSEIPELAPGPFERQADFCLELAQASATMESGDSLSEVLERLGLNLDDRHHIAKAVSDLMDLTRVRAGTVVTLSKHKVTGLPARLEFVQPGHCPILLYKTPVGYTATTMNVEPVRTLVVSRGRVKATLWGSAVKLYGLDPDLVMKFADVFRFDVDFLTDVQEGDEFRLLFENVYRQGQNLGSGRILAAEYVNKGKAHRAYYYVNSEGEEGYFDENGRSLKTMFLKSPLQYRRISSFFSKSRMHPILKYRRPHLGVDYAAPSGTPVETVADGTVEFIGRKGGYGKLITVRHNKTYSTMYAHLSKFAKGLKQGAKVEQGQLIGYVGATGLASGPHLDFRVKCNRNFIDPLSLDSGPRALVGEKEKKKFLAVVAELRAEMERRTAVNIQTNENISKLSD